MTLRQLYFISFIEGGVVMVTEMAGAKILTPFFGASLYSWASTLSITLFALMTGYYCGGYATTKPKLSSVDKIILVFLISGLTVLLMPSFGNFIMRKTISLSFFSGLIISELFFLFVPIFLMGMVSPMIIFHMTKNVEQSGRSAGNVYAISTSGGILFTLVFGFLIIPSYGITLPLRILGVSVAAIGLVFLIKSKVKIKKTPLIITLILLAAIAFNQNKPLELPGDAKMKLVEKSEGLLGELKVVDELTSSPDGSPVYVRKLKTNNIQQNYVFVNMPKQSLMHYVNFTRQLVKCLPKKETALLVGLGAGSLYSVLHDQNIDVETVEIDKRIYDMGVKYFAMPEHKHAITDGRYYINVTDKKYDLVMIDVIIGENVPGQLITLESFKRCYEILNEGGVLLIEHGAVNNFASNAFVPSLVKTLNAAGFQVHIFNPVYSNKQGDIMFLATKNRFDISRLTISKDVLIKEGPLTDYELPIEMFNERAAKVFTDDKNDIDILLKSHYFQARKGIRRKLETSTL